MRAVWGARPAGMPAAGKAAGKAAGSRMGPLRAGIREELTAVTALLGYLVCRSTNYSFVPLIDRSEGAMKIYNA